MLARKPDDAIAACTRLIASGTEKGRDLAEFHRRRCGLFNGQWQFDRALADCSQAIALDPGNVQAHAQRGYANRMKGDHEDALKDYGEALRLDPNYAVAYGGRCIAFLDRNEFDRALSDCSEAVRLAPQIPGFRADRCLALRGKQELDRAVEECNEAVRLGPKSAAAFNARGLLWRDKRELDRAVVDFTQAITIDPRFIYAYVNRGYAWLSKRDYDRAVADHTEALRINPQHVAAYTGRAEAFVRKQDYDRALADADTAIKLRPRSPHPYNVKGLIAAAKDDFDRAVAEYTQSIRADPSFAVAFTNRGLAFERKGDLTRARSDFEAAAALPPRPGAGRWALNTARERLAALTAPPASTPPPSGGQGSSTTTASEAARASASGAAGPRSTGASQGQRVALLIANSNYADADAPLAQAAADTDAFAQELKRVGFQVEVARNVTKQQMQLAIENFHDKIKDGGAALFFYSGYGIQARRQPYLVPVNAQMWNERDIVREAVNLETILTEIARRGGGTKLAVIDAARRNPFERRFRGIAAGLPPLAIPKDMLVMYAAGAGEVVRESERGQSLFMSELIKELGSLGATAEEVFDRTRIGVSRASEGEQVPWIASSVVQSFSFREALSSR